LFTHVNHYCRRSKRDASIRQLCMRSTPRRPIATTRPSEPDDARLRRLVVEHGRRAA
jgi:hypothetical protein